MKNASLKQVKYIKKLATMRDWSTLDEDLRETLKAILKEASDEAVSQSLTVMEASDLIDGLAALPVAKTAAQVELIEKVNRIKTNWRDPKVQEIIRCLDSGELSKSQATTALGVKSSVVDIRLKWFRKHGTVEMPEYVKRRAKTHSGIEVVVPAGYVDVSQHQIDWAGFFGIEELERFDLRVVAAHFYAAERIVTSGGVASMRVVAQRYISTWAERFAKYTLAACLGEFRHRTKAGTMKLVPMDRRHEARAACQRAAEYIWGQGEDTAKRVAAYLEASFKDSSFFRSSGAYGGPKWSKIARTLQTYLEKRIPDVVFADYVWDLSHNAGRFFDKCPLFTHESENRAVLTEKKASASKDILPWAKKFLRPEWSTSLETLEAINWKEGDPR